MLYGMDQKRFEDDGHLIVIDEQGTMTDLVIAELARGLLAICVAERPAIDASLDRHLTNWTLHRLAVADRSLLRLGCAELLYRPETPPRLVINEYIELAKHYGSDGKTAKLVNAVLDAIAREHRGDEMGRSKSSRGV